MCNLPDDVIEMERKENEERERRENDEREREKREREENERRDRDAREAAAIQAILDAFNRKNEEDKENQR